MNRVKVVWGGAAYIEIAFPKEGGLQLIPFCVQRSVSRTNIPSAPNPSRTLAKKCWSGPVPKKKRVRRVRHRQEIMTH